MIMFFFVTENNYLLCYLKFQVFQSSMHVKVPNMFEFQLCLISMHVNACFKVPCICKFLVCLSSINA